MHALSWNRVGWLASCLCLLAAGCVEPARTPSAPTAAGPPSRQVDTPGGGSARLVALDDSACRERLRDDATPDSLRQAAERNLEYLSRLPAERRVAFLGHEVPVWQLVAITRAVLELEGQQLDRLCDRFRLYQVQTPEPLLVTGYYQPELRASRKRTERFRYPVYRTPDDLVDVDLRDFCPACPPRVVQGRVKDGKLVPYYTRAEIEAGALSGRGYELAWLEDPVEAYFLHVQGSALLELEDGVRLQVSYAASNGHPYKSLAKILSERGKLSGTTVSLRMLKDYLRAHPEEQAELFAQNPRWIFFRAVVAGPVGSCNVPLTPGRSIATDPESYSHGALAFLEIDPRSDSDRSRHPYRRFVFLQDAGSAVSGPHRLDVYWGSGSVAEAVAGEMQNPGRLYFLLPRE